MQQNDYLQVGVITSTHGIKGEVKVFPTTDDPNRFRALKDVVLDTGKEQIPLEIEGVKFFKQYVILKFKGIDNINDIEKYRKMPLLVSRENAVELEEDEYYIADIIGMSTLRTVKNSVSWKILWKPVRMMSMWYRQRRTQRCFFRQSMTVFWM